MAKEDITHMIERLEAFEDRVGVTLEGLFASTDDGYVGEKYWLAVNGELHPKEGTELGQSINVVLTAYDSTGRVIGVASQYFDSKSFFAFEAFSLGVGIYGIPAAKVRVYPKTR